MGSTEQQAVLDRIEEDLHAVLLVGPQADERVVPAALLPADTKPGSWLRIATDEAGQMMITLDAEETERVRKRIQDKLQRLRQRGRKLGP